MNCSQCSAANPDGAKFCSKCGQPLTAPTAESAPAPVQQTVCPACSAPRADDAKFCGACGYRFDATEAAANAETPTETAVSAVSEPAIEPVAAAAERVEPSGDLPAAANESAPAAASVQKSGSNLAVVVVVALLAVAGACGAGWYMWFKPVAAPEKAAVASAPTASAASASASSASEGVPKVGSASASAEELDPYGNPIKSGQAASAAQAGKAEQSLKQDEPAAKANGRERKKKTEQRRELTPHYPAPQTMPGEPRRVGSIDEQFRQRAAAECGSGPGALFCREKVRYRLCQNRWSESPAPGQTICQRAN
ncbi:MAG: Double zinc ribbon [Burkholderiaceae bacterium]|nr:Double zinc ribbon [Burkholderiaceae bacterium]